MANAQIAEYCGICDNYTENGSCAVSAVSSSDQQEYVNRGLCGWGMIDGVHVNVRSYSVSVMGEEFPRGSTELERALKARKN
jgi:hypothetical protein